MSLRREALVLALLGGFASIGAAQERPISDLKALAPDRQVTSMTYCRGQWEVRVKDGSIRTFREYDLSFKTDSSSNGPGASMPALVPTGRVGDRAFVIFASPEELGSWVKKSIDGSARCR